MVQFKLYTPPKKNPGSATGLHIKQVVSCQFSLGSPPTYNTLYLFEVQPIVKHLYIVRVNHHILRYI